MTLDETGPWMTVPGVFTVGSQVHGLELGSASTCGSDWKPKLSTDFEPFSTFEHRIFGSLDMVDFM